MRSAEIFHLAAAFLIVLAGCMPAPEKNVTAADHLLKKDHTQALRELDQALAKESGRTELYLQRGGLLEIAGKAGAARRNYERALKEIAASDPGYPEILWRLALLLAEDFDDASTAGKLAEQLPENSHLREDASGMAELAAGDLSAALDWFNQALSSARSNDARGWTLYHAALTYNRKGDEKNAFGSLYHAINQAENAALVHKIEILWDDMRAPQR